MRYWSLWCLLFGGLLLGQMQAQAKTLPLPEWQSPEGLDHPHLGQALDTASGEWISPDTLIERLQGRDRVLVGEQHDNPDHQRLQLWLLQQLQARRPQAALLLEMLEPPQQPALDELQGQALPADAELQQQLSWTEGWPWTAYGPLVRWGLAPGRVLLAANLSRQELRALYGQPEALSPHYSAAALDELKAVMRSSHCDRLPEAQVPAMLAIQQGRDQRMASVLKQAPIPALLVAGSFHVRKDLGLPVHWPEEEPDLPVVLILVQADKPMPGADQADFVWLTAATEARDHCAEWD
ncbi:MAG: ChaN family lipoprotein [Pseudomonas sp.]